VSSSVQTGELGKKVREKTCIRTVQIRTPKAAPVPTRHNAMINAYNLAESTLLPRRKRFGRNPAAEPAELS